MAAPQIYSQAQVAVTGTAQPTLPLSGLRRFQMPRMDIKSQQASVASLTSAFARADRLEAEATRARTLLDRLESAVLGKAFRGELVPQDPNDEPASVLLERIRARRAAAPTPKRHRWGSNADIPEDRESRNPGVRSSGSRSRALDDACRPVMG
jgi:type I restriction enzyme, S subunit